MRKLAKDMTPGSWPEQVEGDVHNRKNGTKLEGGPWTGGPTSLEVETPGVHPYIEGLGELLNGGKLA